MARDPLCGPVRAGGVRWGQLPQAFCLDPLVNRRGAPWGEAVAAASLEALSAGEARCFEPNKRPVTKASAGQLEAAGPVWGQGQARCGILVPLPFLHLGIPSPG